MSSPVSHVLALPAPVPGPAGLSCLRGAGTTTITTITGTSPVRPVVFA